MCSIMKKSLLYKKKLYTIDFLFLVQVSLLYMWKLFEIPGLPLTEDINIIFVSIVHKFQFFFCLNCHIPGFLATLYKAPWTSNHSPTKQQTACDIQNVHIFKTHVALLVLLAGDELLHRHRRQLVRQLPDQLPVLPLEPQHGRLQRPEPRPVEHQLPAVLLHPRDERLGCRLLDLRVPRRHVLLAVCCCFFVSHVKIAGVFQLVYGNFVWNLEMKSNIL